jgi:hypothetical protein
MKTGLLKVLCIVGIAVFSFASVNESHAQARASAKTNVLSIDALGLIQNQGLVVGYEWKSSTTNSWLLRAMFAPTYLNFRSFGFGAAYRFYIADSRALTGLSVAPAAEIIFVQAPDLGYSDQFLAIGGDAAYKWIFDQFSVEPELGVRIGIEIGKTGPSYWSGFQPHFGVALGYAW